MSKFLLLYLMKDRKKKFFFLGFSWLMCTVVISAQNCLKIVFFFLSMYNFCDFLTNKTRNSDKMTSKYRQKGHGK